SQSRCASSSFARLIAATSSPHLQAPPPLSRGRAPASARLQARAVPLILPLRLRLLLRLLLLFLLLRRDALALGQVRRGDVLPVRLLALHGAALLRLEQVGG